MMGWNSRSIFRKSTAAKFSTTEKHRALACRKTIFTNQPMWPFSQLSSMYCQADSSWRSPSWNCTGNIWHLQDIHKRISSSSARWVIDEDHGYRQGCDVSYDIQSPNVHMRTEEERQATWLLLFQAWMKGRVICPFHGQTETGVTDDSLYFILSSLLCA